MSALLIIGLALFQRLTFVKDVTDVLLPLD